MLTLISISKSIKYSGAENVMTDFDKLIFSLKDIFLYGKMYVVK